MFSLTPFSILPPLAPAVPFVLLSFVQKDISDATRRVGGTPAISENKRKYPGLSGTNRYAARIPAAIVVGVEQLKTLWCEATESDGSRRKPTEGDGIRRFE